MSHDLKRKCPRCGCWRRKTKGARDAYAWKVVDGKLVCYVCIERAEAKP